MRKSMIVWTALAGTALSPAPALAQDAPLDAVLEELTALRQEVSRLNERVQTLEGELEQANAKAVAPPVVAVQQAAAPAPAEQQPQISWNGAPEIEGEGGWSFKPRGRIQADVGFTDVPDGTGRIDGFGSELRRARLGAEGSIPGGFGYKFEVDFAGNEIELSDAILTYKDGDLTLSAGQHNGFQSLEELTSSRFSSFIERAAFTDAFEFERRLGFSAQYSPGDVLLQAGVFSDNIADMPGKSWSADGRAVYLPKLGSTQLHLGGSVHYTDLADMPIVRYRQRPLVHFTSNRFIDTGEFTADSEFGAGLEAAVIHGRFHAAGEAFWRRANQSFATINPTFFGGYAEVGYFLTHGDRRGYKNGVFDRTRPASPVDEGGIGAIQLNLRYDYLDLSDAGIIGGTQNGYLVSLVWVPTDYTRFMLNYGRLQYDNAIYALPDGDRSYGVDSVGMRAQVDF